MTNVDRPSKTISAFTAAFTFLFIMVTNTQIRAASELIIENPDEVERWYVALGGVNHREFRELIADDAKIVLKDLGVEQTKQEFISALEEWENATRDANIVYRYEAIADGTASVLVCYRFKSNEQLNIESFTFSNGRITGSVQDLKGTDCSVM